MRYESSSHPASWFAEQYRSGALVLKPPYQRKPVWGLRQKAYLVESLLLRLPVPEIYMQKTTSPDGATVYAIVDGQQRIRTLLQFIGVDRDPEEESYNRFLLDKLPHTSPWYARSFDDFSDLERVAFYEYPFAVRYLMATEDSEIRDMFRRLNRFLAPLKPQELRNATYLGPFVEASVRLADDDYWIESRVLTAAAIRRMGDVEFMSELLIGVLHGPQGGSASLIDEYYTQYEDYDDEFPGQKEAMRRFRNSLNVVRKALPDIAETRWSNKTDFYSLFVAIAALLRDRKWMPTRRAALRKLLLRFGDEVTGFLGDRDRRVRRDAVDYVLSVEKGANDKRRRAQRHETLIGLLSPIFAKKSSR